MVVTDWIYAPRFLEHPYNGENDDRLNATDAALAAKGGVELKALFCSLEVFVLTQRYASEIDGHTVDCNDNWWWRARGMGMTQWCHRIEGNWTDAQAQEWCRRCLHQDNQGHLSWRLLNVPDSAAKILKDFAKTHGIVIIEGFPK